MKNPPFKYQIPIIDKVRDLDKFALWMGYGTGKSYVILDWIHHNHKRCPRVLIVCKRINLVEDGSWPEQIKQHTNLTHIVLDGSREKKTDLIRIHADVHLITYDSLDGMFEPIKKKKYDLIVFDESSKIKNPKAQRAKIARKLVSEIPYTIIADGFPVSEHLDEIWSQYNLVDTKHVLTDNYWKFMMKYFYKWRFGWQIKKDSDKKIIDAIAYNSVFVKLRDCVDLPPRQYRYIALSPTPEQRKYMEQLKNEFALTLPDIPEIEFQHVLPVIVKQQQICSGFCYQEEKTPVRFSSPKYSAVHDLVLSIPEKKIIWCQYTEEVNHLHKILAPLHALKVVSSQTNAEMSHNLQLFKSNPQYTTLITTYALLESGETLTMAQYSIHFGHIWSNKMTDNAKHRIYRIGAEVHDKIVYIHIFIKDSIEEIILKNLKTKKSMQRKLIEYMEGWAQ